MKVSILIISFNQEKYIGKAIDGVLMQKHCIDSEIIFCDDCSTDETVSIATKKLNDIPNVRIFVNTKNEGITRNYQSGFSRCSGEYIFIVEGDDYWIDPLKISTQVEFMENNPAFAMCAHLYYSQQEDLGVFTAPPATKDKLTVFDSKDLILNYGIINNFSTCCYRADMLRKIEKEVYGIISYDWMINISIGHFGLLARINTPMSVYRISASGVWSGTSGVRQLQGILKMIPEYNRVLKYRYDQYFKRKIKLVRKEINMLSGQYSTNYFSRIKSGIYRLLKSTKQSC